MFISSTRHHELVMKYNNQQHEFEMERKDLRQQIKDLGKELKESTEKVIEAYQLKEKQFTAAMEDKMAKTETKLKEEHMNVINVLKSKHLEEKGNFIEKVQTENYDKLSSSLTKLHEEGNAQTKFVQELAVNMAGGFKTPNSVKIGYDQPPVSR